MDSLKAYYFEILKQKNLLVAVKKDKVSFCIKYLSFLLKQF